MDGSSGNILGLCRFMTERGELVIDYSLNAESQLIGDRSLSFIFLYFISALDDTVLAVSGGISSYSLI